MYNYRTIIYISIKKIKMIKSCMIFGSANSISFIVFTGFLYVKVTCADNNDHNSHLGPVPPRPSFYKGAQYFSDVRPIPCTAVKQSHTTISNTAIRNGLVDSTYRWTNFNLYLDDAYEFQERSNINDAMWTVSQLIPCVPFGIWPRNSTPTGDYVYVIKGNSNGCSSYAGRQGGRQIMNLQSPGCMHKGTITHELLHALGFHHEHGRPDRDDYIEIQWENVEPGLEHAFQKYSPEAVTSFGVEYNIKSIMHYDNHAFSKNGQPTITVKNGNGSEIMGSLEMQQTDIEKLQRMYNCSLISQESQ